jgi:Na+-translocating ferredoxin:NAD+ oxidoreductase RnfC subunit
VFCEHCVFSGRAQIEECNYCQGTNRAAIPLTELLSFSHKEYLEILNKLRRDQASMNRFKALMGRQPDEY